MSHELGLDVKFYAALYAVDVAEAQRVRDGGCPVCSGPLDAANFERKPRGDLGEAAAALCGLRLSLCCRVEGCRRRATPASVRFLGRKVYVAAVVVIASVMGGAMQMIGRGRPERVCGVASRTVRRWLVWWRTLFVLSAFWKVARGHFAIPVVTSELPSSLLARFGGRDAAAIGKMLAFVSPITTTSVSLRTVMAM